MAAKASVSEMAKKITYRAAVPEAASSIIASNGFTTPHGTIGDVLVSGGSHRMIEEGETGQSVMVITPDAAQIEITYFFDETSIGNYPNVVFEFRENRFTRFADDLVQEAKEAISGKSGLDAAAAIACAAAERFTYGHPEEKFNDGMDEVPALGCGLVEGSCVDINTYFIAALRAAEIEAGYVTGFFFPEEKQGLCTDGHCWVVTRIDGQTQEWDIAHHLKLGTKDIKPALNPKPGFRVPCFHSMGLNFPEIGVSEFKALLEPMAIVDRKPVSFADPEIRLIS